MRGASPSTWTSDTVFETIYLDPTCGRFESSAKEKLETNHPLQYLNSTPLLIRWIIRAWTCTLFWDLVSQESLLRSPGPAQNAAPFPGAARRQLVRKRLHQLVAVRGKAKIWWQQRTNGQVDQMLLVSRQERETDARGQSDDPLRSADSLGKQWFFAEQAIALASKRKVW